MEFTRLGFRVAVAGPAAFQVGRATSRHAVVPGLLAGQPVPRMADAFSRLGRWKLENDSNNQLYVCIQVYE